MFVFEPLEKRCGIYYYDHMLKKLGVFVFFAVVLFVFVPSVSAVQFDLIPPSGTLVQGQEVTFIINLNTQGDTVSTIQTGMTYDTVPLQYVSAAAGAAMNSLTVDTTTQGTGKLLITGTNNVGFTGSGVFTTVVFKILTPSGSTELCTLWQPTATPTPTSLPVLTATPQAVQPTATPAPLVPTALPQTGFEVPKNAGAIAGGVFLIAAGAIYFHSKRNPYTSRHTEHKKRHRASK
jgi:LPXTG-motif cell wall-anchored protein